jgi:hypothetical protein
MQDIQEEPFIFLMGLTLKFYIVSLIKILPVILAEQYFLIMLTPNKFLKHYFNLILPYIMPGQITSTLGLILP